MEIYIGSRHKNVGNMHTVRDTQEEEIYMARNTNEGDI